MNSDGSSVFLKKVAILTPESFDKSGLIYSREVDNSFNKILGTECDQLGDDVKLFPHKHKKITISKGFFLFLLPQRQSSKNAKWIC